MIDTIKDEELKIKKEDLLKNMKMLRHTVADMFGSKSFFKGLVPGESHNGMITVNGEQFPVYISAHIIATDRIPSITDDIFDKENYLSLLTNDNLMWYALVEHLAHQTELLQEDNIKYSDDLVNANEEIDKLNCKLAEEIKARQGYEESLHELKEELTAANNEIEGLEESLREANKKCTEYVNDIGKLEAENNRLSERVKTLVCEKCNGKDLPLKFGEQERGTPEDKVVRMDLEAALMQQQIAQLNTRIAQLEEKLRSTETELTTAMNANGILKTQIASLMDDKKEAELMAYRLTRGDMHVQFDSMKSLEHENGVLKNENADLNQKLMDSKDYNKRLRQEITKLRVETGRSVADDDIVPEARVVTANDNMQYTISLEKMNEVTARINELETKLKDKDEYINQLSKNNAALSVENRNFGDLLKEADGNARFYAREVDHLREENDKIYSILNDAVKVVRERNKKQSEADI